VVSSDQDFGRVLFGLVISAIIALILTVVQLPDWLFLFWPDWIAMVLIYWALKKPEHIGPFAAFIIGTLMEVLFVRKFGVLGLGLATLAFIANSTSLQIRIMTVWQQTLLIGLFIGIFKLITGWLYGLVSDLTITREYWYPILSSMLLWPFVFILLEELRRALRIR